LESREAPRLEIIGRNIMTRLGKVGDEFYDLISYDFEEMPGSLSLEMLRGVENFTNLIQIEGELGK